MRKHRKVHNIAGMVLLGLIILSMLGLFGYATWSTLVREKATQQQAAVPLTNTNTTEIIDPSPSPQLSPSPSGDIPTHTSVPSTETSQPIGWVVCTGITEGKLHVRVCPGVGCVVLDVLPEEQVVKPIGQPETAQDGGRWRLLSSPTEGWVNTRHLCFEEQQSTPLP